MNFHREVKPVFQVDSPYFLGKNKTSTRFTPTFALVAVSKA